VIGTAGAPTAVTGFELNSTLAQPHTPGVCAGSGYTLYAGFWRTWTGVPSGVHEHHPAYSNKLHQNYPNPFNPTTTIEYIVAERAPVDLMIYNVLGQRVRHLVNEQRQPGPHRVTWGGRDDRGRRVASGIYFYRLRIGGFSDVKKMVVLK
jgi:hypothetical protein